MDRDYYITPEEYEIAEKNGISRDVMSKRVRGLCWRKQRAMTEPIRKHTKRKHWAELAKENGISYNTFMTRVNDLKWDEERAATEKIHDMDEIRARRVQGKRRFPQELVDLAASNGIGYNTFYSRVKNRMTPEEAATTPILTKSEAGRRSAMKRRGQVFG